MALQQSGSVAGRLAKVILGLAVVAAMTSIAARAQDELGFARAKHLRRGINLSMWYAQDYDLYNATGGAEKLATYITPADFKLVHDLGFDHVRLSIDPVPLVADKTTGALRPEAIARLDETVKQITATGLVVVLDIHPEDAWKYASLQTDDGTTQFFAFWKSFAAHFAGTDPDKVYFEVMNEPAKVDLYRWAGEQAKVVEVIRSQAPHHTIIVGGANWNGINGLQALEPLRDDNIIYTFHDYNPMTFTHQGATWAGEALKPLQGVPYPSTPENVAPLVAELPDGPAKKDLAWYGQQRWSAATMEKEISVAVEWAKQRHVPLWCGEFGVFIEHSQPADRDRWIADMRKTLEKDGIGWNMWDYRGGFALVSKKDGVPVVDEGVADALGLKGRK
jgi:aryl-phospho-beta-D-glucosidase BglC (GH1 family)